jgi:soluble lytic murein transglycosylase-like protein
VSQFRLLWLAAVLVAPVLAAGPTGAVIPPAVVPFQALFQAAAGPRWIDRGAQAQAESGFNPRARSMVKGKDGKLHPCAFGLTQFTPGTWKMWAPAGADPYDPAQAIKAQCRYMPWLEARVQERLDPALGSYNAGVGSVLKAQALAERLGLPGENAWLQALVHVTGAANQAQTAGYIKHNAINRATIRRKLGVPSA